MTTEISVMYGSEKVKQKKVKKVNEGDEKKAGSMLFVYFLSN